MSSVFSEVQTSLGSEGGFYLDKDHESECHQGCELHAKPFNCITANPQHGQSRKTMKAIIPLVDVVEWEKYITLPAQLPPPTTIVEVLSGGKQGLETSQPLHQLQRFSCLPLVQLLCLSGCFFSFGTQSGNTYKA